MRGILAATAAALALSLLATAPARADGAVLALMSKADHAKFAAFNLTRAKAIAAARKTGAPADRAALEAALAAPVASANTRAGDWQCRWMKLGGKPALAVSEWSACRMNEDDGVGETLELPMGAKRMLGFFFDDGPKRLIFVGVIDAKPAGSPADLRRSPGNRIGYAFSTGPKRMRIEFPKPDAATPFELLEVEQR